MATKEIRAGGTPGKVARKKGAPARRRRSAAEAGTGSSRRQGQSQLSRLKRLLADNEIRLAKLGLFDIDGVFRGKYVSIEKLLSAAESGLGFCDVVFGWDCADKLYDNSKLTGAHTGYPDAAARIDPQSFRLIPWEAGTAAFLLDLFDEAGQPHPASPRGLLSKVVQRAHAAGLRPKGSYEFEFFLFDETPRSVREKGFRDLRPLSPGMFGYSWLRSSTHAALIHEIVDGCAAFGIPIEGIHTETGPGVYEVALAYDDLLLAADHAALFKTAVKEICAKRGVMACFMAKWNAELPGCSGHVHQSIWTMDGARNLFAPGRGPKGKEAMPPLLRHFLGGQLALMPELTALISPTVNSYKRYVPGVWAPLNASWGRENRSCALRLIEGGKGGFATRLEHRQPAADSNPYVTMATLLAAGLHGIEQEIEPPAPATEDASTQAFPPLPGSLEEAIEGLERSRVARELLGEEFVDHYLRTRRWEAAQYRRAVTAWELDRYFEII